MAMAGNATGAPSADFAASGCGLASSENQKKLCGPSVKKYGASVMTGNFVRPNSSTGIMFLNADKSSSTGCVKRERLATTRMVSFSWRRM